MREQTHEERMRTIAKEEMLSFLDIIDTQVILNDTLRKMVDALEKRIVLLEIITHSPI